MKRRVALVSKTPLKRLRKLRQQSAKAKARAAAVRAAKRELAERTGGRCMYPACHEPGTDFHHIKKRSRGGSDTAANGALLCRPHHRLVETNEHMAHALGLSLKAWEP